MTGRMKSTSRRLPGHEDVELLISCSDFIDLDTRSNIMCVLYVRKYEQWHELARTEALDKTPKPKVRQTVCCDNNSCN